MIVVWLVNHAYVHAGLQIEGFRKSHNWCGGYRLKDLGEGNGFVMKNVWWCGGSEDEEHEMGWV